MNIEEAIKRLKSIKKYMPKKKENRYMDIEVENIEAIETVLADRERLKEENKNLKIVLNEQIKQNEQLQFENEKYVNRLGVTIVPLKDNYISKDKIKEKIELLKMEEHYDYIDHKKEIAVLQKLLKEG